MQASCPSGGLQSKHPPELPSTQPIAFGNAANFLSPTFDWLIYAGIVLCSFAGALLGAYRVEADTVAYLDLSDAVRLHRWHALFNPSWFPLYPALVAIGKALFADRPSYEFMAARLVDALIGLFFVVASVLFARSVRRLMLARGAGAERLLPVRTLDLWTATFAYFFVSQDFAGIKPDALLSIFVLLAVAALLTGIIQGGLLPYVAVGLFGALAYWTKAFAFPVFLLWLFVAAMANLRNRRILASLLLSLVVFALVAGPYVWQISKAMGHFTIGDAGTLNSAWYVNGADRFNPISNLSIYQRGNASASFKHPGELLASNPEITYYGGDQVFGTTPQWDDFAYWSDGLKPRFNLRQSIAAFKGNLAGLVLILPMRLQALFLIAALGGYGYSIRKPSLADPILLAALLLAIASLASILLVHFEARYITFAFVIIGVLYAACSLTPRPASVQPLHTTILLMAGLILLYSVQQTVREWKTSSQQGAQALHGIYSLPVFSAGAELAALYPPGSEVACMGDTACWSDPYWAKYAGLKMTAIVQTGNGYVSVSATDGCTRLQQNPAALDTLRKKHIRAIVAEFGETAPCSPQWLPLGISGHFYRLPL